MDKLLQLYQNVHWQLTADISQASHQLINMQQLNDSQQWLALFQQDYYLLLPAAHDLAQRHQLKQRIHLNELSQLAWIERSHCEFVEQLYQVLSQSVEAVHITARVDNEDWAIALVAAGLGATIIPLTPEQLDSDVYAIALQDIEAAPQLSRKLGLACGLNSRLKL